MNCYQLSCGHWVSDQEWQEVGAPAGHRWTYEGLAGDFSGSHVQVAPARTSAHRVPLAAIVTSLASSATWATRSAAAAPAGRAPGTAPGESRAVRTGCR
jgi:hypothetical protein